MKLIWFFVSIILFIPILSHAQIITEIMYDLDGGDTGREWVEITNTSSDSIDLSLWRFYEAETNHGLTLFQGDPNLSPNQSAIIVDNPDKFLADWPNFSGTIFDSSFSLKNSGETISLRNPDLVDIDLVDYIPDWGGGGDGNSLQISGSLWAGASPNPGQYDYYDNSEPSESSSAESSESSESGSVSPVIYPEKNISTKIISEKIFLSGADSLFKSKSLGILGEPLEGARHTWNFGDGTLKEGEQVLHNFIYPGEYIVVLDVVSGKFYANDRMYVSVVPSELSITESSQDFIKLHNDSSKEINISFWILSAGNKKFTLPKNTYIMADGDVLFSREVTGLNGLYKPLRLLYPNGKVAYDFDKKISKQIINDNKKPISGINSVTQIKSEKNNFINEQVGTAIMSQDEVVEEEVVTNISETRSSKLFNKWFLGVVGVIVLSILSILFIRENKDIVEEYRIIE